jgi:hypothetical protein
MLKASEGTTVAARPLAFSCPICNNGRQAYKAYCPDCIWAIDKLQDLSRSQLKTKLLKMVRELQLVRVALA